MSHPNVNNAIKRICFQFNKEVRRRFSFLGEFYHYTSQDGLYGILSQPPSFWFSQYDHLNDEKECLDIMESLEQYLTQIQQGVEFSSDFIERVLSLTPSHKNAFSRPVDLPGDCVSHYEVLDCQTYICSFSMNNDSPHMWENYADNGYCLTVNSSAFRHNTLNKGYRIDTTRVIYDKKEKFDLFDMIIYELYKIYITADELTRDNIIDNIQWFINDFRYVLKRELYKKEQEVRVVITIPNSPFGVIPPFERKVRNGNVPYIEVKVDPYYFYEVKLSPEVKGKDIQQQIFNSMMERGHSGIKILKSNIYNKL